MRLSLMKWLACPRCGADLDLNILTTDEQAFPLEVLTGVLKCHNCGDRYPVVGGIPRMLPDSAEEYRDILAVAGHGERWNSAAGGVQEQFRRLHKSTEESFGFEWLRYRVTGLEENTGFFRQVTGFQPADLSGKLVLDAGCGMGRFLEVAAGIGAEVIGLDLSRAVERAQKETQHRSRVHFIQGNLMRPPFKRGVFDSIYSIGVLHHTPSTRQSFEALCPLLRPKGRIAIWLYRTFQPEIEVSWHKRAFAFVSQMTSDGVRVVTTRLPHRVLHALCCAAVPVGWLKRKVNENAVLKYALCPVLLLPVSDHPDPHVRLCDTFDWLSPRYQWKHTTGEVMAWFRQVGLTEIRPLDRPVSVTGIRPVELSAIPDDGGNRRELSRHAA